MEFYTVKEIAHMLSVNEETVRRWIRDGRLEAERGSGRQGSKISDAALKKFLEGNKGLTTTMSAATLGMGVLGGALATMAAPMASVVPVIGGALFGSNVLKKLKDKKQDKKEIKLELMEEQYKLEQQKGQLNVEIARLQGEADLIDSQIKKIKMIIDDIE